MGYIGTLCFRCFNITSNYPSYTVEFDDIAYGPEGTEGLGGCSQMAVFKLKEKMPGECAPCEKSESINPTQKEVKTCEKTSKQPYKLIKQFIYPVSNDKRTPDEILKDELYYHLFNIARRTSGYYDGEDVYVALSEVYEEESIRKLCDDVKKLR